MAVQKMRCSNNTIHTQRYTRYYLLPLSGKIYEDLDLIIMAVSMSTHRYLRYVIGTYLGITSLRYSVARNTPDVQSHRLCWLTCQVNQTYRTFRQAVLKTCLIVTRSATMIW